MQNVRVTRVLNITKPLQCQPWYTQNKHTFTYTYIFTNTQNYNNTKTTYTHTQIYTHRHKSVFTNAYYARITNQHST